MNKYLKTVRFGEVPISFNLNDTKGNLVDYVESNYINLDFELRLNSKGDVVAFPCVVKYNRYIKRLTSKEFYDFDISNVKEPI